MCKDRHEARDYLNGGITFVHIPHDTLNLPTYTPYLRERLNNFKTYIMLSLSRLHVWGLEEGRGGEGERGEKYVAPDLGPGEKATYVLLELRACSTTLSTPMY